ncbi:MAG: acyl-CoA dehydrogenase family protein [Chloroflexi bacterium]|nr:acyl-CoA dehydrogenase family protein [Chloroflexota bacterium]
MMPFDFNDKQKKLRQRIRDLTEQKIAPGSQEREETRKFPWDMEKLLRDEGFLYMPLPRKYGGEEASLLDLCIVTEEISRWCNNTAVLMVYFANASFVLSRFCNREQQEKYYPMLRQEKIIPALTLTEDSGGSDLGSMLTEAKFVGNEYVINGTKRFISSADVSSLFTIFAKTDPSQQHRGISAFLFHRNLNGKTPGLRIKREKLMGMHSSDACEMQLKGVRVPRENLIGAENQGFKIAMKAVDYSRPLVAARAVGTAQGALDCALSYAKERQAFGQKIVDFQGIQFMLADMATQVEAARRLTYMAASYYEHNSSDATIYSSMAKLFAADVAMKVTTDAVQILGGRGVTRDYPVQRLMIDAKIQQIVEGTNQIQRMIIGRRL